jgi:hypothetical protein
VIKNLILKIMLSCAGIMISAMPSLAQSVLLAPPGPQTVTQPIVSGSQTTLGVNSLNGILNATLFGSPGDLGAQINSAYSACPSNGCIITVPPGSYSAVTGVVIATMGKPAIIECAGTSTTITWTPKSGTMFQFAANGNSGKWAQGIDSCQLVSAASGTTAVAVQWGVNPSDTTGRSAQGGFLNNVQITGFQTQDLFASQAWNISAIHSNFLNASLHSVWMDTTAVNSGENISFVSDTFGNSLGIWTAQSVLLNNGNVIANFVASNFDNAELSCLQGTCNVEGFFGENPGPPPGVSPPLRTTPFIDAGSGAVFNLVTMTATDDDTTDAPTQPDITVEGTLNWTGGGTIFGEKPATGTVVTSGNGHAALFGDFDVSTAVPLLVNNSGLSAIQMSRGAPGIINQAFQLISPTTAAHWLDLENNPGAATKNDVFIEMDSDANRNNFLLCMQSGSVFDCPLEGDPTGHFLALGGGAPDSSYNIHLYNATRIDSLSIDGGAPIATANAIPTVGTLTVGRAACIKAAGPPVVIGYCSTVVSSSGACTCN